MRQKISVVGGAELARSLSERDYAEVVEVNGDEDVAGSSVVVLAEPGDRLFGAIRDRAPNAVVVVAGHSPSAVCEATLFPRARIIGTEDADAAADVVDSVVLDRGRVMTCVVRCEGEHGIEGEFAAVPVRVGAGGVREIVED